MDEILLRLETEYCPPLDGALVSAILSDYDLNDQKSVEAAREILDSLREDALIEEAAGFDPSGMGAGEEEGAEKRSGSRSATSASLSRDTEDTSLSNGLSSLSIEDGCSDSERYRTFFDEPEGFDDLDEDGKVKRLQAVFNDQVNQYSIRHALRKCKGKWDHAVEDLLTQAYLADGVEENGGVTARSKGVEGFSEDRINPLGRKGRNRNRKTKKLDHRRSSSVPGLLDGQTRSSSNRWTSASEDIDFVSSRTGISRATVSSTYSSASASLSKTIAALLKASMTESKNIETDEATIEIEANYLGQEFPTIALEYRIAIVRLAYPSSTAAHELATALTIKPRAINNGGLKIIPQYAPTNTLNADSDMSMVNRKARSAATSRSPSIDGATASARGEAYRAARAEAFAKASAAHRKAKSDRLMGGAAAYYGQIGREYSALSSNASANAADALADSQSTATQLDLHGVDVLNAVRIAQERVEEWWDGLGESRVNGRTGAGDRQAGYRIVVGLGRHSEGGKGKLGPAVSKKLREEGWRVEPAGAVLVVKGPN